MEEADVLCNRIGIVTDGGLRCIGQQVRLKSLYGGGYHLFVNCHKRKYISLLKQRRKTLKKNRRNSRNLIEEMDTNVVDMLGEGGGGRMIPGENLI